MTPKRHRRGQEGMVATKRPTSADVAREAGVSRATVSYVLNGSTRQSIPETTRARVRAAAEALGYTPNPAARALRSGRSTVILFLVRHTPYGSNVGLGTARLAERAAERGFTLLVWQSGPDQPLSNALAHLQPRVVTSFYPLPEREMEALAAAQIPFACTAGSDVMSRREEGVSVLQVRHLAEKGHRRLGYLTASGANVATWAEPRREGFLVECEAAGLPKPRIAAVALPPAGTSADVVAVLREWTAGDEPVTAVAAYNDAVAAMALAAARELDLAVPEQLAVIGVDDEAYAALLVPPLTTIRVPMDHRADELFEATMRATGDEVGPAVDPEGPLVSLVPRQST